MSVPFEREAPEVVTQSSPTRCWAAALECWMQAECLPIVFSQDRLVEIFRNIPGALQTGSSDRATTEVGASILTHLAWMNAGIFRGARLTAQFWGERLQRGYVFLWYARNGIGHCGVVYGVTNSVVKLMDPWQGRGLYEQKIDFFLSCQNALIGTSMINNNFGNPFGGLSNAPVPSPRTSGAVMPGYDF